MNYKMAENSLFAVLLRSPWWISMLIMLGFAVLARALLPAPYVPFGVMGGLPFLVIGVIRAWRQWQAPDPQRVQAELARIGSLSWREFAAALEQRYAAQGYRVTRLSGAGADFKLEKGVGVTLVSARRWKATNHGVEALRELLAERDAQGASQCCYLSLGGVSEQAGRLAREQSVQLVAGNSLALLTLQP